MIIVLSEVWKNRNMLPAGTIVVIKDDENRLHVASCLEVEKEGIRVRIGDNEEFMPTSDSRASNIQLKKFDANSLGRLLTTFIQF